MKNHTGYRIGLISAIILLTSMVVGQPSPAKAQGLSYNASINKSFAPIVIPAGGVSVLTLNIYNPNPFVLYLSSLPPAFTDTLPANVTFANPANPVTTCTGSTISIVGTTLSVIGGTVPAQVGSTPGSCIVTVNVTSLVAGNWINTIPANSLTATDPTGTIDVSNSTPASATLQVNSVQPPSLSKGFAPNTQWVGQNSVLSVTILNNDTNYGLSGITFIDNLPAGLVIGSPATAGNTNCGSPTITGPGGAVLAPGDISFTVRSATAPVNGSCVIRVNVTTTTPNPYINSIPAGALTTTQGVTNSSAASAQVNFQTIGITKSFTPNSMQQGGVSRVVLTLQNPSAAAYTNAAVTDNLPSGMTVVDTTTVPAAPANPITTCRVDNVVSYTSNSVSLTGGTIPSGGPGTCTITFYVTAGFAGTYTNTIPAGALTASSLGGPVSTVVGTTANLTVYATGQGVGASKSFGTNPMAVGGTSLMTINIVAPADTRLDNFSLTDSLPSGLAIATTSAPVPSGCGSGTLTAVSGTGLITYTGGTILASATCHIYVNVTSSTPGIYTNYISPTNITDTQGRTIPATISASLTVSGLTASKVFTPTAVNTMGISTLTISLNNTNLSQLDNVSFTDMLPGTTSAGVVIAPTPNASTTCGSGTVTAVAGTQAIQLSGGTVPAQVGAIAGLCTVNVDVIGVGGNATYTNTLPNTSPNWVTGTIHGTPTVIHNSNAPTAQLTIRALSINIVKGFNPTQVFGGAPSTMSIVLTNPQNVTLTGISFSDNLPQDSPGLGMFVANPPATTTGTCGGSFNAVAGASSFSYSGGTLAANASCTLTIAVSMNVIDNRTNTIPANAVTTANGSKNGLATSASLTNLAWASVSKSFAPNPVALSTGVSTLTITIQSVGNVDLSGMGLVDDFSSAGLTVVGSPTTTCTDGTMTNTATSIRLQNASLQSDSTCTVTVNLTAVAAGNKQNCIPVGALTDTQNVSNTAQACDTLVVIAPPTISKAFSPSTIAANATSTLTFTLRNPAANTVPLTGVSFTDVLPVGVTVPNLPNPSQCNGGTVSYDSGTNTIALTGGTIGVNTTCTVTAGVTSATGGSYLNTSNAVSSTNGGTGNSASATLTVISPPVITKDFSPNPITIGNDSVLHFQITNPNPSILHNIAFTDTFPLGLHVASTPAASSTGCNAASTPTFNPLADDTSLTFSNGSIAASGTCDIYVSVTANGGTYPNATSAVSSLEGGTGNTASDTLVVQGAGLSLVKSTTTVGYQATDDTITYNYLLTNTGDATLYSPFEVTDDHLGAAFSCGSATILDPGDTTSCTANYMVVPGDVTTRSVTNTAFATALDALNNVVTSNNSSTTVQLEQLTLLKTVPANTYYTIAGNTFTYTYTLTNTGLVTLYGQFTVTDDHFGSPLNCGAANLVLPPGGNVFCTRTYTVVNNPDVTPNGYVTNSAYATGYDQAVGGRAIASNTSSVTVYKVVPPTISKAFSPAAIAVGDLSTLTFTITNPSTNVIPLVGVAFSDPLPAGVTVAAPPVTPQCGGTVSSTATSITFSGGTVFPGTPPNNTCTVTANVTGTTAGTKNNTSSNVTSSNGGNGTVPATATLTVMAPPTITKSFSPSTILVGGTSTLTLTITAPTGNPVDLTGVSFTDDLPSGLQWASPASINLVNCTPTYSFSSGGTHLSITNTTIYTGYPCTIQIPVTATAAGTFYNTTSAVTTTNGGTGATSNTAVLTANEAADLSITKDDGKLAFVRGQTTTYNIVVTNGGPSDVTGASVIDTPPSSLTNVAWTCTPDIGASCTASGTGSIDDTAVNIPANEKVTYAVTATVSSSTTTDIVNTAVVLPPAGLTDSNLDNNIATDTDQLNKLTIAKSVSPTTYATTEVALNYSYTITNTGTSTLNAPFAVVDNKVTPTCSSMPSTLAPNDSFTCTVTYPTVQADLDAGSIVNSVYATGVGPDGDTVTSNTDTKTVNATPDLYVTKSDGGVTATPGSHIIYTLKYRDVYHDATGVVLTETLPTYTTFDSADSTSGWSCVSGTCTFTVGSLTVAAGEKQVFFAVTVNSYVPAGVVNIHNAVTIDDDHSLGADVTPDDNTTTTDTPLTAQPVFTISKDDGETTVVTGQTLVYTIDYSNAGDQGATGVVLTETLPDNTTFNAAQSTSGWDCSAAPTCTFAVGALAAGSSNTGSAAFAINIDSSVPAAMTQVVNTVSIDDDHSNGTGAGGNNRQTATDTDTLNAKPTFTISKDDGVANATPGQRLTYTIDYSNTGDQGATGVVLTEIIPDNTTFNAAHSTTGWDCSAAPTCTLAVGALAAGSNNTGSATFVVDVNNPVPSGVTQVVNTVSIDDDHSNGTGTSGDNKQTATDTDTLDAQPVFAITKSDGVTNAVPGQTLVYTINYGNTGNQDATGVVLTETIPTNTTFNPGSSTTGWDCSTAPTCTFAVGTLAGGGSGTSNSVAFAVNVNNPVPSGATQIFNTVTIDDDHVNGDFHQTATDTDTLDAQPAFVITKDDGVTSTATSQTLVYTIDYGNTGNQDATGVVLTETIPPNTTFNPGSSTAGWDCSAAPTCTLSVGDLPGGGSISSDNAIFAVDVNATIPAGVTQIVNTVTIDDDHTNGDFHQTATDTDTLNAQPAFTITKDDGQTTVVTGQTLVYTIDYSNVGDQGATGVELSETIPANTAFDAADSTTGWSCDATTCTFTVGGLSAGTSNSGSATFAVTVNTTIPAGVTQIVNTVSIDDDHANGVGPGGDNKQTATDTDDITAQPAFTISKTDGVTQVAAGSQMTYTITVTNNGDQDATGVVVKDVLDGNVDFVSVTPAGQAAFDSGTYTVTWNAVALAAGATLSPAPTVTVKVHNPLTGVPEPTQIINNVQVDDDHSNGVNPDTGDNKATASDTDGISFPTKAIVGHDGPEIALPNVAVGEGLLYETTVQITPGTVTNLKLVDTLDHGLAFWKCDSIYGTGSATGLTEDPSHPFADLCSGATATIEPSDSTDLTNAGRRIEFDFGTVSNTSADVITLHVRYWVIVLDMAGNVRGTTLNNNAQWTWDGGTVSAQAGAVTVVEPTLTLTKVSDGTVPAKGRIITYTLTIDHAAASNEDAYDVVLSDVVPLHLAYVPGSLQFVSGQTPTTLDDSGAPTLQVKWDDFQLNPVTPTVRQTVIQFQATVLNINPGQTITNTASIEWRSMHNPVGPSVARSPWNTYSMERRFDPTDSALNNYRTTAQANIRAPELPNTGFAPGKVTPREAKVGRDAQSTGLSLEIPALNVKVPVVGIPYGTDGWDLTWLEKQAGYLEGTAYPTWKGNSVITGHVYNADGTAGIFVNLSTLKWGDQVIVHDGTGQEYIYEVRNVTRTTKDDLSPLQHEDNAWVTLLTCEGYDATTNQYTWRVAVSAVLIKVQPEQ